MVAYQTLFKKLQAEPAEDLPLNFAANVRWAVQYQAKRKDDLKFQIILFFAFTAISAIAFGLLHLISPAASKQLVDISPKFKWSGGLAVLVFWSIHFGSQILVRDNGY